MLFRSMIRDITIGNTPPMLFVNPVYVLTAVVTSVIFFWICYFKRDLLQSFDKGSHGKFLNVMDTVGLGIVTIVGVNTGIHHGFSGNAFLCIVLGMLTGIGGGILRDVLAMRTPIVLHKHVYAVASMIGAIAYYYLQLVVTESVALLAGVAVIIIIRMCATIYNWDLPKIKE